MGVKDQKHHGILWYCEEVSGNYQEPGEFGPEK